MAWALFDGYWEYKTSEAGRERQNIPVPLRMISKAETGNGYYPLIPRDVFPRGVTVTVKITPSVDNHYVQRVWVGFNGFYVLEKS